MPRHLMTTEVPTPYREYQPTAELLPYVECFWTYEAAALQLGHRVLPDGCSDIVFSRPSGGNPQLLLVGTMTRAGVFDLPQGSVLGVRFRPGMSVHFAAAGTEQSTGDALHDVWGASARQLCDRLAEAP